MTEVKSFSYDDITVYYLDDGVPAERPTILKKIWHREDGPAYISSKCSRWYYKDQLHRLEGPASISIRENGDTVEEWYINNGHHREGNLPARTSWSKEGKLKNISYSINGTLHRTNGPAFIHYFEYEKRQNDPTCYFMVDGKNHTAQALDFCDKNGIDPFNMNENDCIIMEVGLEIWAT